MNQATLGYALEGRPEEYLVATKLGYMRAATRFRSYDALRAQLDEGLRLLRRDSVDAVKVHESDHHVWWTDSPPPPERREPLDPSYDFAGAPVMQVLRDIKEEGLCRFVGVTGNTTDGVGLVASKVDADICLIAFNYDILRRRARRETIPVARAKNMSVVLGAIIRLPTDMPDALERLYAVQRESGLSLVELTIRYLLSDRDFSSILVGAAKPSEIEESVAAAEKGPLPADLHQALKDLGVPKTP